MLDGPRDQGTATFRGGNIAVVRDGLASACPNEVGHMLRYCRVLPEPRYVGPQVVHHNPGAAFGEKFDVCPSQPAACPGHNHDLSLQRNSFGHLAILLSKLLTERRTQSLTTDKAFRVFSERSQVASLVKCCSRRDHASSMNVRSKSRLRRETLSKLRPSMQHSYTARQGVL